MKRLALLVVVIALGAYAFTIGCSGRCEDCERVVHKTVLRGVNFDFDKFNNDDSTITKVEGENLGEYDENSSEENVKEEEQTQAKKDNSEEEKDPFNLESNEKYEADIDIDFSLNNKD